MSYRYLISSLCFILFSNQRSVSQHITRSVEFDQYFNNPVITNPARVHESDGFRFNRRSLSGPFKNVTSLLGSIQQHLRSDSGRNQQGLNLTFLNEKEGGFLNRTRIYGGYSWSTKINNHWRFTGGSLIGVFNYFVKSSNTSAGGSVITPDIHMGVWMNTTKTGVGISMNQLLNNSVVPFGSPIQLERHYNLGFSHIFSFNSLFDFALYSNSIISNIRNSHRINTVLKHKSGVDAGVGVAYKRGLVFTAGLNGYQLSDKRILDIGVSYFMPTGEYSSQISKILEVSLGLK